MEENLLPPFPFTGFSCPHRYRSTKTLRWWQRRPDLPPYTPRLAIIPAQYELSGRWQDAGVAYGWGILLDPAVGAVLMSASTVIVAINAQLLRRQKLD